MKQTVSAAPDFSEQLKNANGVYRANKRFYSVSDHALSLILVPGSSLFLEPFLVPTQGSWSSKCIERIG